MCCCRVVQSLSVLSVVWMLAPLSVLLVGGLFFFFKQKTAYEMRISDWSSDVCSSDLDASRAGHHRSTGPARRARAAHDRRSRCTAAGGQQIGRASCRERVCQYV